MKTTLKTLLIALAITLPIAAYAGHDGHGEKKEHDHKAEQCMQGEDCPMHEGMKHPGKDGDMKKMHKNMGEMKGMKHNKKDDHGDHKH